MALVLMKRGTNPCSTRWLEIYSNPLFWPIQPVKAKTFSLSQPSAIFLLTAVAATGGLRILFIFTSFTRLMTLFWKSWKLSLISNLAQASSWRLHDHPLLLPRLGHHPLRLLARRALRRLPLCCFLLSRSWSRPYCQTATHFWARWRGGQKILYTTEKFKPNDHVKNNVTSNTGGVWCAWLLPCPPCHHHVGRGNCTHKAAGQ